MRKISCDSHIHSFHRKIYIPWISHIKWSSFSMNSNINKMFYDIFGFYFQLCFRTRSSTASSLNPWVLLVQAVLTLGFVNCRDWILLTYLLHSKIKQAQWRFLLKRASFYFSNDTIVIVVWIFILWWRTFKISRLRFWIFSSHFKFLV